MDPSNTAQKKTYEPAVLDAWVPLSPPDTVVTDTFAGLDGETEVVATTTSSFASLLSSSSCAGSAAAAFLFFNSRLNAVTAFPCPSAFKSLPNSHVLSSSGYPT